MNNNETEHVKVSSSMWLGAADCMMGVLCNIVTGGGLTFFFVNYFGMDPKLSALCWLIFGIWNALNDPLFGYISDRTKSKLGRRIPYIRYGSILVAAVFVLTWGTWFQPGNNWQMFAQMLTALFLFDMLYTAIATSIYIMPFEMAVTNKARSKILLFKVIFNLLSLTVPLVVLAELQNILSRSLREFQMIMTLIGLAAGIVIFTSSFFYKEKGYTQQEEQHPFFQSILICFKNKSFIVFEVLGFSITFIQTILMIGLSYYFEAYQINYLYCYIFMFIGILFGIYMWTKLSISWGVKKSVVLLCSLFAFGLLVILALGNHMAAGIVGCFFMGIGFAGGMYLIPMMNGDVIDYDEHLSGLRREGMYAGVNSLICKPSISIANALFPLMLGWFRYDITIPIKSQTELAKFGIRFSWVSTSALLLIISAIFIYKAYPLCGDEWKTTKEMLAAEHAKKQAAYENAVLHEDASET